jgi:hypothetical protein
MAINITGSRGRARIGYLCEEIFEGLLVYISDWFELLQERQQSRIQVD